VFSTVLGIFAVKNAAARCICRINTVALGSEFDKVHQNWSHFEFLPFVLFPCSIPCGIQYRILLYISQQQQIATARIHPGFVLTVRLWVRKACDDLYCPQQTEVNSETFTYVLDDSVWDQPSDWHSKRCRSDWERCAAPPNACCTRDWYIGLWQSVSSVGFILCKLTCCRRGVIASRSLGRCLEFCSPPVGRNRTEFLLL